MNNRMMKAAVALIILFLVVFAGFQVYNYLYGGYRTESVYASEVSTSYLTRGIMVRDEAPMEKDISGVVVYSLAEGGRFRYGTLLAYTYADEASAAEAATAEKAEAELSRLKSVKSAVNSTGVSAARKLAGNINKYLRLGTWYSATGNYGEIEELRLDLTEALNRVAQLTGDTDAMDERIAELEESASGTAVVGRVTATCAGYFSRYVDGMETQITPELLETADSAAIEELAAGVYPYDESVFGKAVRDYRWYYVTTFPAKQAESFNVGSEVKLTFVGGSGTPVSALVYSVTEDTGADKIIVCFEGESMNGDAISVRSASVEVSFGTVEGVRFPKEALRIIDGVRGVYVDNGYSVGFKKVDIVYTGDDFCLSRLSTSESYNSAYLSIFDEIIIGGTDLYDGKPLV